MENPNLTLLEVKEWLGNKTKRNSKSREKVTVEEMLDYLSKQKVFDEVAGADAVFIPKTQKYLAHFFSPKI